MAWLTVRSRCGRSQRGPYRPSLVIRAKPQWLLRRFTGTVSRRLALLALVTLTLVACGSPRDAARSSTPPGPTPVPWIRDVPISLALPTPTPTVIPPGTALCGVADVLPVFNGIGASSGGQLAALILLGNRSDKACLLTGIPVIKLYDQAGRVLSISQSPQTGLPSAPVLLLPHTTDVKAGVPEAGVGYVEMDWATHDGAGNPCLPPPVSGTSVSSTLPAGGLVRVAVTPDPLGRWNVIAPCYGQLLVSAFQPWLTPEPSPMPAPFGALSVHINAPNPASAGKPYAYSVTLSNTGKAPFSFPADCPAYGEWGGNATSGMAKEFHVLNCSGVGALQPGAAVTFAMQVSIAAGTPPGAYGLWWSFEPSTDPALQPVRATITVR